MRNILSKYIKDIIFGANDGIITTFAVVAGAMGASLSVKIILILGFSNLLADGFSMGAGNYLGSRSEREVIEAGGKDYRKSIITPAVLTFFSFVIAGSLPLLPFILCDCSVESFMPAIITTAIALFVVGASLGYLVLHRHWFWWGFEMLFIGGIAAGIAYGIGYLVKALVGV